MLSPAGRWTLPARLRREVRPDRHRETASNRMPLRHSRLRQVRAPGFRAPDLARVEHMEAKSAAVLRSIGPARSAVATREPPVLSHRYRPGSPLRLVGWPSLPTRAMPPGVSPNRDRAVPLQAR